MKTSIATASISGAGAGCGWGFDGGGLTFSTGADNLRRRPG